jgi:hypothetical protein
MEALELLKQLRGKTLDPGQLELLRHSFEAQRTTIEQLEAANLALARRNNELHERLQRFEAQATRLWSAAHDVRAELEDIKRQRKPGAS